MHSPRRLGQESLPLLDGLLVAVRLQLGGWGISRSGVAKIEIGLRQVTDIEVVKLAGALNVSAAWLLGEGEEI